MSHKTNIPGLNLCGFLIPPVFGAKLLISSFPFKMGILVVVSFPGGKFSFFSDICKGYFSLPCSKADDVFLPSVVCIRSPGWNGLPQKPPERICHAECLPFVWQKRVMWVLCMISLLCMSHECGLINIFLCICRHIMTYPVWLTETNGGYGACWAVSPGRTMRVLATCLSLII